MRARSSLRAFAVLLLLIISELAATAAIMIAGSIKIQNFISLRAGEYEIATSVADVLVTGAARSGIMLAIYLMLTIVLCRGAPATLLRHRAVLRLNIFNLVLVLLSFAFTCYKVASIEVDKATPPKAIYYAALVVAGFFPFAQMVTLSVILILPLLASFKVPETRDVLPSEGTPLLQQGKPPAKKLRPQSVVATMQMSGLISDDAEEEEQSEEDSADAQASRQPITISMPTLEQQAGQRRDTKAGAGKARKAGARNSVVPAVLAHSPLSKSESTQPVYSKPSIPQPRPDETPEEAVYRKRMQIVAEVVETEERYVEVLSMIIDVFKRPLERAAELNKSGTPDRDSVKSTKSLDLSKNADMSIQITMPQVKSIFLEIESIFALNSMLCRELQERYSNWNPEACIGDVFVRLMMFFKTYVTFANNFDTAIATIGQLRARPGFHNFLRACLDMPRCNRMWLDDHLISPIQRIPRYILLLKDLLRRTPPDHPDYGYLQKALEGMQTLATSINDLMMIKVQRMVKYCPSIVAPARQFINDFPCIQMDLFQPVAASRSSSGGTATEAQPVSTEPVLVETANVVLYLFNDLLMAATHEQVEGILGKTQEVFKTLGRQVDYLRPVTETESGQEVIHKYKFQLLSSLHGVTVEVYEDTPPLECGFVLHYPQKSQIYRSPSNKERKFFLDTFARVKLEYENELRELPAEILAARQSWRTQVADEKLQRLTTLRRKTSTASTSSGGGNNSASNNNSGKKKAAASRSNGSRAEGPAAGEADEAAADGLTDAAVLELYDSVQDEGLAERRSSSQRRGTAVEALTAVAENEEEVAAGGPAGPPVEHIESAAPEDQAEPAEMLSGSGGQVPSSGASGH